MDWNAFGTWLGVALSGAGLVVSVGGFWIAISQIRRTRSVVEAARSAVTRTERRLASNNLLLLIPQLLQIDSDFAVAIGADRRKEALILLVRWRHVASQTRGLAINSGVAGSQALADSLERSITLASTAERALADDAKEIARASGRIRSALIAAAAVASEFVGSIQAYTGEEHE